MRRQSQEPDRCVSRQVYRPAFGLLRLIVLFGLVVKVGLQCTTGDKFEDTTGASHSGTPGDSFVGLETESCIEQFGAEDCGEDPPAIRDEDGDGFPSDDVDPDRIDCDDENPWIYPGASEICDDVDDDCDGLYYLEENAFGCVWFYEDIDEDGYGWEGDPGHCFCEVPEGHPEDDDDNEGSDGAPDGLGVLNPVENNLDCDDGAELHSPVGVPMCDGFADDNCDSEGDLGTPDGDLHVTLDRDGDGYGQREESSCPALADMDPSIPPPLLCLCSSELADLEASGIVSGFATSADGGEVTWHGECWTYQAQEDAIDCYDNDPTYHCSDLRPDADGDGFGDEAPSTSCVCPDDSGYTSDAQDCNDADSTVYPGAAELCEDLDREDPIDSDCDGSTNDVGATGVMGDVYYRDADDDGYGDVDSEKSFCYYADTGYTDNSADCDDSEATTYPDATEWCEDGVDNDCDIDIDESEGCTDIPDAGDTASVVDTAGPDTGTSADTGTPDSASHTGIDTSADTGSASTVDTALDSASAGDSAAGASP